MLDSLQSQSEDIRQQFHSLQNQFQNIASESGAGLEEKEHIIEQLVKERQNLEDQMSDLTASEAQLKESMASLKEQNAHLQGQLESAVTSGPNLDDFKRVLKEKNALDNQLGSERLAHQQELIKTQAKVARVETELRDTKRESKRKEKNLREELNTEALQYALQEKDQEIQYLQEAKITLEEENSELRERLKEETDHVAEIERASCLVAQQLKENALEIEDRLKREKSELAVEIEHLKGRLAGINTAQQCMREHATSLENSLAQKESQLTKLASETSSLLGDKDLSPLSSCSERQGHEIESLKKAQLALHKSLPTTDSDDDVKAFVRLLGVDYKKTSCDRSQFNAAGCKRAFKKKKKSTETMRTD
ncbi:golgin subfamily A member 3-like [Gigantopelta aegis]|uniref:golgin subfamily A member 3-like n=1 Tax=Gigantopelta aegis TaxID=1735272 RepID=UPI001B88C171|nr:golgin subfamily A member 3-like [Gigantopelta aegis]